MKNYDYDLAVIGGGSGGLTAAVGGTKLGLKTVLIEGAKMGGDCLNFGCVPSKAILHAAKTARSARQAQAVGVHTGEVVVNYEEVKAYVASVQEKIREHEHPDYFRAMGMDVIEAFAEFAGPHTLKAGDRTLTARLIVISTGSRSRPLPIEGLEEAGFATNEEIFSLPTLPEHLLVIGGGPIGIEMAWAYSQFGTRVSVLQSAEEILPRDDADMAAILRETMEKDGVTFHLGARANRVESVAGQRVVHYKDKTGEHELRGDVILAAAGRTPNIEKLNLAAAGIAFTKRGITVDASQRTNVPHVYAVGDVAGGPLFTHIAGLEAGTFIKKAIFHLPAKTDYEAFPWCTYTNPELASVGLNELQAKEKGIDYILLETSFAEMDRAIAEGRTEGKIKVLLEPSRLGGLLGGRILGAQIVGPHAGELIHEYVLAIKGGIKASAIASTVHAYPTLAEINKRPISTHLGKKLFHPTTRKWLKRLFGFAGIEHPGEKGSSS